MNTEQMIKQIDNYINGEDYPDEIPMRIMGLFEREYADLLAEVKRLREIEKICHDDGLLCKECGVWWNIGYKHTEECSKKEESE